MHRKYCPTRPHYTRDEVSTVTHLQLYDVFLLCFFPSILPLLIISVTLKLHAVVYTTINTRTEWKQVDMCEIERAFHFRSQSLASVALFRRHRWQSQGDSATPYDVNGRDDRFKAGETLAAGRSAKPSQIGVRAYESKQNAFILQ